MASIALPKFAGAARKASEAAEGEKNSKAQRLVAEAQAAAGGGRRGKARQQDVLEQLVQILTKLTLSNSNDLREVMGVVIRTYLVPEKHTLVVTSLQAGKEYQERAKKEKEKREAAKQDSDEDEESAEEEAPAPAAGMDEEKLGSPHLIIAMQSIHQFLVADRSQLGAEAAAAVKALEDKWTGMKIGEMDEAEATKLVKVWRTRKPQKQAKKHPMGKYVKLNFSMEEGLGDALHQALVKTGAQEKVGKAPRGYLEREASRLLQKFQKS